MTPQKIEPFDIGGIEVKARGRGIPVDVGTVAKRIASRVRLARARAAHRVRLAGRRAGHRRRQMVAGAPALLLAYLRAAAVVVVAMLAVAGTRAALGDEPATLNADDVVMTVDEAAVWAAEDAAWWARHAALMDALAALPDNGPGSLTDEIVDAFVDAVIRASYK